MDFWHDAAAQKRWMRRFALLTGLLLVPVFVLAVFARPSADDYIYAARTHAVIQQYGFDLPRLLKRVGHKCLLLSELAGGCMSPALRWRFSCHLRQPVLRCHTALCAATALFLSVRACALCSAALVCGTKAAALGAGTAADLRFYRGNARPGRGLYWFNGAMNYLPYFSLAVLNAGLAFALCFAAQLTLRRRVLYAAAGCLCSLVIGGGHQVAGF